ncbi:MAG: DUF3048 domain-containing protein [Peptococcaceae bacterium]|jgi:hypothetical protein|nr:DUF3048 domain-containing protein [Peptococcaceae bacterium]
MHEKPKTTSDFIKKLTERFTQRQWLWIGLGAALTLLLVITAGVLLSQRSPAEEAAPPVEELEPAAPEPKPELEPDPEPEPDLIYSYLTGLPINEEDLRRRPVAVVINNIYASLPQSGIAEADILYEVLAEGDITRMVAVFQKPEAPKIGSVRSVRDYFVDFALDYDSILMHHGHSETGDARIKSLRVDQLDGMKLEGTTFWRDPERFKQRGMYEHSSYTGAEQIEAAIKRFDFRRFWDDEGEYGYQFNQEGRPFEEIALESGWDYRDCTEFSMPFSQNYTRRFVYDPELQHYLVFNREGPQIDEALGSGSEAQLHMTNVLMQHVSMHIIPNDEPGRRETATTGTGNGLLFTEGICVPVTWSRETHATPTRWYFTDGQPLMLNPGTTFICVLQNNVDVRIIEPQPAE